MSKFLLAAMNNEDITIFGKGDQTRTFCFVNDNVDACVSAFENDLFINDTLDKLEAFFEEEKNISGIIHFAAFKAVNESVEEPLKYYQNNIIGLLNMLACCKKFEVKNFVFSSSCSVYGNAKNLPVSEKTTLAVSESPYAETKVMAERIIRDFTKVNNINIVLLRYFNPIGAHKSNLIGEKSKCEPQNVIPRITLTALGKHDSFKVYGSDYDTKDGTCVRDYIHVSDIAHGHTLSLKWLFEETKNNICEVFNLGSGTGTSVLELITAFEKSTGQKLNYTLENRRPGDVVAIYANNDKAKNILAWKTKFGIEEMMQSAWNWDLKTN
eukprot:maker-scaffold2766_size12503-snap-gene-0.0 protein:Tk06500 transcript:maker-scaffold2766_size12503-snap-gene-0.0-mRNA-1 annotation:"UDP-galactose-4-epimerase"